MRVKKGIAILVVALLSTLVHAGDSTGYPRVELYPAQPEAGDSLILSYILGVHPTTCVPEYSAQIVSKNVAESYPPIIMITVNYEEIRSPANEPVCGQAFTEYGPVFDLGVAEFGNYFVKTATTTIATFSVAPPEPSFPSSEISGSCYITQNNGSPGFIQDTTTDELIYPLAGCTVAVAIQIESQPKTLYTCDTIGMDVHCTTQGAESRVTNQISEYIAVTDTDGRFLISDIPTEILNAHAYLVAVNGNRIGFGDIPFPLQEQMTIDMILYSRDIVIDSALIVESRAIAEQLAKTHVESSAYPSGDPYTNAVIPAISVRDNVLILNNPLRQKITIDVYSPDGKRIKTAMPERIIDAGMHSIAVPSLSQGIFLIRIRGDRFHFAQQIRVCR
ncbi:MAG: hypothetical protein GF401_03680 [Chitinivibrionales bacterium]|nr:hypothetical protein [Chitinivibrionales bacterium]